MSGMKNLDLYIYPRDEDSFKERAVGRYVRTLIVDTENKIHLSYSRKVSKMWSQTVKNNIETDHRIKELPNGHYKIYNWVTESESDSSLPLFLKI